MKKEMKQTSVKIKSVRTKGPMQTKEQLKANRQAAHDKIKEQCKQITQEVRQTNKTNAQLDRKALLGEVTYRVYSPKGSSVT